MSDEDKQREEDRRIYAEAMEQEPLPVGDWEKYKIGCCISGAVTPPEPQADE
jgi:hypothetical protein